MRISQISRRLLLGLALASALFLGTGSGSAQALATQIVGAGVVQGFVELPAGSTNLDCQAPSPTAKYTFTGVAIAGAASQNPEPVVSGATYIGSIPVTNVYGRTAPIGGYNPPQVQLGPAAELGIICPDGESSVFQGNGNVSCDSVAGDGGPLTDTVGQGDLSGAVPANKVELALCGPFFRLGAAVLVDLEGCWNVGPTPPACVDETTDSLAQVSVAAVLFPDPTELCTPAGVPSGPCPGTGVPIGTGQFQLAGIWVALRP